MGPIGQVEKRVIPFSVVAWLPKPLRPLSRRLPLMLIVILVTVFVVMAGLRFHRTSRFVVQGELDHLRTSAHQLRANFQSTTTRLRGEAARLSATPEVVSAVSAFATTSDRAAAQRVLATDRRRSTQAVAAAIWSTDGKLLAFDGNRDMALAQHPIFREDVANPPEATHDMVSPLIARGDTLFYGVTAPVLGTNGATIGYVVSTRRIANSVEAASLFAGLVGVNARVMFGNAQDGLWTDFARVIPVTAPADTGTGAYEGPDGVTNLYALTDVPETPWRVMIEVPRHLAMAAARGFAVELLAIAVLFIALGAMVIWVVIRRSLRPLDAVTKAVVGLSRGDHSHRVAVTSDDELGHLANAFNTMVARVQESAAEASSRAALLEDSNRELHESEQRYRLLIDHLPDAIVVHRDQQIAFVNAACARLLGLPGVVALIGRSVLDFVDADERAIVARRLAAIQSLGAALPVRKLTLRRTDGSVVRVEATSMPLSINGETAVQTILHDVTDQLLLEERLRQSQKMEAVGRLAGGIAHDFNNLLTVIDAHAEFAMRAGESEQTRNADIEEIMRASSSAARLTQQLLTFSRRQAIAPTEINLTEAVKSVLVMLNRLIGDDVRVTARLEKSIWPIHADPSHVEQVLLNLALNARDAMPTGGTLTFETGNARIGPDYRNATGEVIPEGEYVVLTVQDTGTGMTDEVLSKVFEPFFTTKQPGRGTGLGLSTVYGIVKQTEGFIWLVSQLGRGTMFKVLLPRYLGEEPAPALIRPNENRAPAITARILVVEDQRSVRLAVSRSLRQAGFVVTEAEDAEEAIRLLAARPNIDLILTDMVMPGKTGAELLAEVAITHPGMPAVIMSGYSEEMTNREWRLPEGVLFVEKPVNQRDLARVINELLGRTEAVTG